MLWYCRKLFLEKVKQSGGQWTVLRTRLELRWFRNVYWEKSSKRVCRHLPNSIEKSLPLHSLRRYGTRYTVRKRCWSDQVLIRRWRASLFQWLLRYVSALLRFSISPNDWQIDVLCMFKKKLVIEAISIFLERYIFSVSSTSGLPFALDAGSCRSFLRASLQIREDSLRKEVVLRLY